MSKSPAWADKVWALIQGGNTAAAVAQIKVAPSIKDLNQLKKRMAQAAQPGRWREVEQVIDENLALLAAPRLHRAP